MQTYTKPPRIVYGPIWARYALVSALHFDPKPHSTAIEIERQAVQFHYDLVELFTQEQDPNVLYRVFKLCRQTKLFALLGRVWARMEMLRR